MPELVEIREGTMLKCVQNCVHNGDEDGQVRSGHLYTIRRILQHKESYAIYYMFIEQDAGPIAYGNHLFKPLERITNEERIEHRRRSRGV